MNYLYITLFFNIVAGIVQTFIKSWNQLLYPRVIEVCRQPSEPLHHFFLHLIIVIELFPSDVFLQMKKGVEIAGREVRTVRRMVQYIPRSPFALRNRMTERTSHLAGLWIGAAISNTSHCILPLSNEHGSQVNDQDRQHYCHNKHKKFPCRPKCDVSLLSGHASYFQHFAVVIQISVASIVMEFVQVLTCIQPVFDEGKYLLPQFIFRGLSIK